MFCFLSYKKSRENIMVISIQIDLAPKSSDNGDFPKKFCSITIRSLWYFLLIFQKKFRENIVVYAITIR